MGRFALRVLITGNLGYVGPVVTRHLRATHDDLQIVGYDSDMFGYCLLRPDVPPQARVDQQIYGDVRDFDARLLDGVDAVVHLAAVSNDPMGDRFEEVTRAINFEASHRVALAARDAGVGHFVFASSCSMYGAAEGGPRKETDQLNPLTAYARSKVATEEALASMDLGDMVVTALRFATACGISERLRLDLVLNDFVAGALTSGHIEILSDGTPWRPLIDVADMARAIDWAIGRDPEAGGQLLRINAGSDAWNYQVKELADAVAASIPEVSVSVNQDAAPDKRSYQVDFARFAELAPDHQPAISLEDSIARLSEGLRAAGFDDPAYRTSHLVRLQVLERHIEAERLDRQLRWV